MGSPDGGTRREDTHISMMGVAVTDLPQDCETYSPEAFGLRGEIAQQVMLIIDGKTCKPVYISPKIPEECPIPQSIPLDSNIRFKPDTKTTLFVLAKGGGYDLQQGEAVYEAFEQACKAFPDAAFRAQGIEIIPVSQVKTSTDARAKKTSRVQVKIQQDETGRSLVRIHDWEGRNQIKARDGFQVITLHEGLQVLLDPKTFEIVQSHAFNGELPDELRPKKSKVSLGPSGCSAISAMPGEAEFDLLTSIVLGALTLSLRRRIGKVLLSILGPAFKGIEKISQGQRQSINALFQEIRNTIFASKNRRKAYERAVIVSRRREELTDQVESEKRPSKRPHRARKSQPPRQKVNPKRSSPQGKRHSLAPSKHIR